jgi:membrane-associated phospholipid phosphatase
VFPTLRDGAFLLLFISSGLMAQSNQPSSLAGKFAADVSQVVGGTTHVLTSPFHWRSKDWAIFGSILAGTFALSYLDEPVDDLLLRNANSFSDQLADFGIEYGEPRTAVVVTGSLYVIGLAADSEWLRETCVIMSASLLPIGGIQSVTKYVSGRARPYRGLGHDVFDPFRGEESYYSFFSGHVMTATTISYTFAKRVDNILVKVGFYSAAAIASLARLYNHDHWLSDVIIGDAITIASVNSVMKWLEAKKNGKALGGMQWQVMPANRGVSLRVIW